MYRLTVIVFFIFLSFSLKGQERTDFSYFDSLTFSQYTNGSWLELSKSGYEAIKIGHDYYYMRMRIGISFYERGKFFLAIPHFRKALKYNEGDPLAREYLYYCYLYSGMWNNAAKISGKGANTRAAFDSIDQNLVSINFAYNKAATEQVRSEYLSMNGFIDPGVLIIPLSYTYLGVGIFNTSAKGNGVSHSISYLDRRSSLFTNDGVDKYPDYIQKLLNFKYSVSLHFGNTGGFEFSPFLFTAYNRYPLLAFTNGGMQSYPYSYLIHEFNIGGGMEIVNNFRWAKISGNSYYSKIGSRNHIQAGTEIILYPLGNRSFSIGGAYNLLSSEAISGRETHFVAEAGIGLDLKGKIEIEFSVMLGDIRNFVDQKRQLVYDGINKIDEIYMLDISIPVGPSGFSIFAGSRISSEYTAHLPPDYFYSTTHENNFNTISFIGGISWTF